MRGGGHTQTTSLHEAAHPIHCAQNCRASIKSRMASRICSVPLLPSAHVLDAGAQREADLRSSVRYR
eukprot:4162924-Pyramimonas_sp.AAC.1